MKASVVLGVVLSLLSATLPDMSRCADPPAAEAQKVILDDQGLVPAAAAGNLRQLQQGLKASGAVNARGPQGRTPLMAAAMNGQYDTAQFLASRGADVNAVDLDGYSALALVSIFGDMTGRTAYFLRTHGAVICVPWDTWNWPTQARDNLDEYKSALAERGAQQANK
jgi:hypothetical protein